MEWNKINLTEDLRIWGRGWMTTLWSGVKEGGKVSDGSEGKTNILNLFYCFAHQI